MVFLRRFVQLLGLFQEGVFCKSNRISARKFQCSVPLGKRRMPPKKKEEPKPTPLIGRFGTSLKIGIVGVPNVG